jgi:Domain of unknown function (DUF1833)
MNPVNVGHSQDLSSDIAWLFLLSIFPANEPAIHVVNNTELIVSNGVSYHPYPFDITLPTDNGDSLPKVKIRIDNVAAELVEIIRSQVEPPKVTCQLVTTAFPDIVERSLDYLVLRSVSYDSLVIQGDLEVNNTLNNKFLKSRYTAVEFPGLFY